MPQDETQVDQIDLQEADPADNGLDDNTAAAALAHATFLSEGLLKQKNPPMAQPEPTKEAMPEETDSNEELQAIKDEISALRAMIEDALSEDDDEEEDKTQENEKD